MSANSPSDSMERLNYFNGQRLAATDFRAEQAYHIDVRRLLNRSLYSAGIVKGLIVLKHPTDTHKVIVEAGLAFDHLGREIILLEDHEVQVMGAPSSAQGIVFGNLLTIAYSEARAHPVSNCCSVVAPSKPCSGDLAWGAPTRIASRPVFEFLDAWPSEESGRVVLAQVELSKTCEVERVHPGVRKYAAPVKAQKMRSLSLEGEKDIDTRNPKTIHFHIEDSVPERVRLYLRARQFSTLYYSELGKHTHSADITINDQTIDISHTHGVQAGQTDPAGAHKHDLLIDVQEAEGDPRGADMQDISDCAWRGEQIREVPDHVHGVKGLVLDTLNKVIVHNHTGNVISTNAGSTTESARSNQPALGYVKNVRVIYDGLHDLTDRILEQLRARPGQAALWDELGDGTSAHTLASADGTAEIDLLKLGIEMGVGSHTLTLKVVDPQPTDPDAGQMRGGQIQYNLYVD